MIDKLMDMPAGIDGFRASGVITREEYDAVVLPFIETAVRDGRRLRCLCEVGSDFRGLTPGAVWEDLKLGLRALRMIDGCAVVSDIGWIGQASRLASFVMPCPVRVYRQQDREQAIAWLTTLPQGPGISHRLDPELGVVVIKLAEPLRSQDFDALALTVDSWLAAHLELRGLVVHARAFPGWENATALMRHVRFVRDHHRKISRVALAADGALAGVAPRIGEHFVHAEVRRFSFDDLDAAVSWAGAQDG